MRGIIPKWSFFRYFQCTQVNKQRAEWDTKPFKLRSKQLGADHDGITSFPQCQNAQREKDKIAGT
jgi:hypothetical protein